MHNPNPNWLTQRIFSALMKLKIDLNISFPKNFCKLAIMTLITSVFINCLSPFCGLELYYVFPPEKCPDVRQLSKIKFTGLHIVGIQYFSIFTKISSCAWALFGGSFLISWKKTSVGMLKKQSSLSSIG